jgi:chromosome segregation protein
MPLRLKSLELHGYKTFASKIDFEFAEGITAIVGPNGSGKSNIADALRWVLGEQSYSLLRAKKTEDMIFAGSEQRPRAGMAAAVVTFDNSSGWLPVDFSEVALARRAYRDGRNEYVLNNQHVRLKDINELLAQSGLSERTYTILGQGLVDASLALKADDRRKLFEEAAGIGLYRSRREEALRRLETTQRNLDRVLDILAELEPRLKSLERQASRAEEYTQVQANLRLLLREWYGFHWHHAQNDLGEAMDFSRNHELKLNESRESYQNVRTEFASFRDRLNGLRARLNSWHRQSALLHENRETLSGDLATLDERQRSLNDNRRSITNDQGRLAEEHKIAQERLRESQKELNALQAEFDEAQIQSKSIQSSLSERQAQRSSLEVEISNARKTQDELATRRAVLQAKQEELTARNAGFKQRLASTQLAITAEEEKLYKSAQELKRAIADREKMETEVRKTEAEFKSAQKRVQELDDLVKNKQAEQAEKETAAARSRAQLDVLEQAEQSLAGYAEGARLLLDAARQSRLAGSQGALSASIDVPAELEVAVAAALGEYTDAILLSSSQNVESALTLLDTDQSGRASILPLDSLSPNDPIAIKKDPNCLGVAADLVKAPADLRPALDLLLGQVVIVRDRATARRILIGQPGSMRAVTLLGEVFHATGQILAGKPVKPNALGRPRQRRELQESIDRIDRQIKAVESDLLKLTGQQESARVNVGSCQQNLAECLANLETTRNSERAAQVEADAIHRQLEWQHNQKTTIEAEITQVVEEQNVSAQQFVQNDNDIELSQDTIKRKSSSLVALNLDELQEQASYWGTRKAVAERALSDSEARVKERTQVTLTLEEEQTTSDSHLVEVGKSLEMLEAERQNKREQAGGMNTQLEELRGFIAPAELELANFELQEAELQRKETDGQAMLSRIERTHNQLQLELGRKQEALQNLRQKIEDDFGLVAFEYATDIPGPVPLPFEGMVEQLPVVTELPPELEESMSRQRAQLRRMGAINPEAQQEFKLVKERHTFMTAQVEDLRNAEADLHKVIAELDDLTRREFQKTFDAVSGEFHVIFHRLFGGGSARLTLTDPENLTETGIDIEARLPGRREQGLSLLSGGERSLTAIALVFALLKVSPTPVCVMDEVDAMLDEANVGRFRDLLQELSKQTQFIIITHNRNTVQAADVIYGITMGRDSASQIISLKLDEISEDYLK